MIEFDIEILRPTKQNNRGYDGAIKNGRMTFTISSQEKIKIKAKDLILIGVVADKIYIAKKPEGFFGYTLSQSAKSTSIQTSCITIKDKKIEGKFNVGPAFNKLTKNEQGIEVNIVWYPLNII